MKNIIQILGPTGVGKSHIAVRLAKSIDGEVISADSVQVYRDFNIGTDKITLSKTQGIPHHLIDIYSDCTQFNASLFLNKSFEISEKLIEKRKIPIVCGGTALYLKAMIRGIFPESKQQRISREKLVGIADNSGISRLWKRLKEIDPSYALKIGAGDRIRIIRALEIYYNNGIPPSEIFKKNKTPFSDYVFIRLGLFLDRESLYKRIELRVDRMVERNLLEEVQNLRKKYPADCPPFKAVGYKEMVMFLEKKINFEEAIRLIKQKSRNFAKRQLSWFRQERDIQWFHPNLYQQLEEYVVTQLGKQKIFRDTGK